MLYCELLLNGLGYDRGKHVTDKTESITGHFSILVLSDSFFLHYLTDKKQYKKNINDRDL